MAKLKNSFLPTLVIIPCLVHIACGADPDSISKRMGARTFPSVFQAWNRVEGIEGEDKMTSCARHDLVFHAAGFYGLQWNHENKGLATGLKSETIDRGLKKRKDLLGRNPNMVLLAEIRYRDAHKSFLSENHKWWKRDKDGNIAKGWAEGGYFLLDFSNPEYRAHVAKRAAAIVKSGAVDGVMLDWWSDDPDRIELAKIVREAIGPGALLIGNANDRKTPKTAKYINGYFMECYRSKTAKDWQRISETLLWAEANLRKPRINCLEIWYKESRKDLGRMRATTTMSLTHSNGYCLFSDPNKLPTPDHLHNWYGFWDKSLGKPAAGGSKSKNGSWRREFDKGTVVYNPMGNEKVMVKFTEARRSLASGKTAKTHSINPLDGDIFLKE